jgi:glycosyltransferase involved in cell wall biosynthesis
LYFAPDKWLIQRWIDYSNHYGIKSIKKKIIYGNFNFEKIICPSKQLMGQFKRAGFDEQKIDFLPHGVDTNLFTPRKSKKYKNLNYILFVGRLYQHKGVHIAIDALKELKNMGYKNLNLKIIGEGDQHYTHSLHNRAKKLGLSENVHFEGIIPQEKLPEYYSNAAVVIIPSLIEPFGIVAIEAMACRGSLIASRVGGLKEIINNKQDGFLVSPNNPIELAQSVDLLLRNPILAKAISENAEKKVKEHYSMSKFVSRLHSIILNSVYL